MTRRRGGPDPRPLSGIVRSALPKGSEERLFLPELRRIWAEIVGDALARRTFVEDFHRGVVTARADGPASAKMVSMRGASIARELSGRTGMKVDRVSVATGRITRAAAKRRGAQPPSRISPTKEEVDECFEEVRGSFSREGEMVARRLASLMALFRKRFPGA
ncbi:MAG: DUF721 domain-containing protein [Synergistaceae bacterium]|nr:DUF721 domain-containing protein [Synergistaceae bacterium]